jgi:hypothetical protein
MRTYILNALPVVGEGTLRVTRATLRELREAYAQGATSLIGHEATAAVLGVAYNRAMLDTFQVGDVYYIARLKVRLPADVRDLPAIGESDLDVYRVEVIA